MEITLDYEQTFINIEIMSKMDLNEKESYNRIQLLLDKTIIPFNILTLKKGMYLFRARRNMKSEHFTKTKQISYRKDSCKIKDFGRANKPGQAIFYSSHKSETSIFESSSLFNGDKILQDIELITVGKWYVNKDIPLLGIISDKDAMSIEPNLSSLHTKSLIHPLSHDLAQETLKFFSKEFSKNVKGNTNLYKISCAYFNYTLDRFKNDQLLGAVYPSVEYEYKDLNVALLPKAVDNSLILEMVAEFEVNTKSMTIFQTGLAQINNFDFRRIKL